MIEFFEEKVNFLLKLIIAVAIIWHNKIHYPNNKNI